MDEAQIEKLASEGIATNLQYKVTKGEASCFAQAALAALKANGFAVVPVEPTEAMLEAGAVGSGEGSRAVAEGAWEAMIAAAGEGA